MLLLTKEIKKKLPPCYGTEGTELKDKIAVCKFFCPWSCWTWYVIEGDPTPEGDYYFFGYVVGIEGEFGYFTLDELKSITHRSGLKIERDLHFAPTKLSEISDIKIY